MRRKTHDRPERNRQTANGDGCPVHRTKKTRRTVPPRWAMRWRRCPVASGSWPASARCLMYWYVTAGWSCGKGCHGAWAGSVPTGHGGYKGKGTARFTTTTPPSTTQSSATMAVPAARERQTPGPPSPTVVAFTRTEQGDEMPEGAVIAPRVRRVRDDHRLLAAEVAKLQPRVGVLHFAQCEPATLRGSKRKAQKARRRKEKAVLPCHDRGQNPTPAQPLAGRKNTTANAPRAGAARRPCPTRSGRGGSATPPAAWPSPSRATPVFTPRPIGDTGWLR